MHGITNHRSVTMVPNNVFSYVFSQWHVLGYQSHDSGDGALVCSNRD